MRLEQKSRADHRLMFLPDATDGEIALAYERSRALVFPSLAEGFGLPLVEARTRGCPVIASALPSFRELADEGTFLFEDASSLERLIRVHALAPSRLTSTAMPTFTWSESGRSLMRAVEGVAA